jgi:hypothetical protein
MILCFVDLLGDIIQNPILGKNRLSCETRLFEKLNILAIKLLVFLFSLF